MPEVKGSVSLTLGKFNRTDKEMWDDHMNSQAELWPEIKSMMYNLSESLESIEKEHKNK